MYYLSIFTIIITTLELLISLYRAYREPALMNRSWCTGVGFNIVILVCLLITL